MMVRVRMALPKHRALVASAVTFLLVAIVCLLIPVAIRGIAHNALASIGFPGSRGGTVSVGLHHIRIAGIAFGQKGTGTVTVTYSPASLLRGRLDTIAVTDTTLDGMIALNGAVELDGFAPPAASSGPATAFSLPAARVTITGLSLKLDTPLGKSTITGNGELTGTDQGLHLTGTVDLVNGDVTGSAPADFSLSSTGWSLALNPIRVALPAKNDIASAVDGQLNFSKAGNDPIVGDIKLEGAKLSAGTIAIRKLGLNFHTGPDGQSGSILLAPADGGAGIDGTLKSDTSGLNADLKIAFAEIGNIAKAFGSVAVAGPLRAAMALHVDPGTNAKPVTLALTYDGGAPGGVLLRAAHFQMTGKFDSIANAVTLTSCGAFSADVVSMTGISLSNLSGCLGPSDGQPLFIQDPAGKVSLAGAIGKFATTLSSDTGSLAEATLGTVKVSARIADGSLTGFDIATDGGVINLPVLGAIIRDLNLKTGSAADGSISGALAANFGAGTTKSPILAITGAVSGTIADGPDLTLKAGSTDRPPAIKATITAHSANIDLAETALGEGGADLIALMPGMATIASKLSGMLAFSAAADWSGPAPVTRGSLTLKNFGATTPNFTVEGLDTAVTFTKLMPATTAENQVLTMKKLLVGVPLTDGRITFGLDKHHVLNVADAVWSVAGGTVGTHDQHLDLYGPDQNLGVVVKNVDLAKLLVLLDVNGLSAQGMLEGAIPLRHTKDTILVEHGYLQTSVKGFIRYDPTDTPSLLQGQPGEGTAILRDALKDFHYEQLSLTIDGVLGGDEKIKMSLKGANPAVYGGSAIALNLNLSGALDSIARSSIEAYTHPTETVRRKLQKKLGDKK
jgi:hypothetical protein